jgi:hypothetical protein
MPLLLSVVLLFLGVLCLSELVRRGGLKASWLAFGLGTPVFLAYWWLTDAEVTGFLWVKAISVGGGALLIGVAAGTALLARRWAAALIVAVLVINVLEAVAIQVVDGFPLTALAGVLLVLTTPGASSVARVTEGGRGRLAFDVGLDWVVAYTLWNFAFVYGSAAPGQPLGIWGPLGIVHLGVPLLLMRGDAARWLEARAIVLALTIFWSLTFPDPPWTPMSEAWYVKSIADAIEWGAVVTAVAVVARRLIKPGGTPPTLLRRLRPDPAG